MASIIAVESTQSTYRTECPQCHSQVTEDDIRASTTIRAHLLFHWHGEIGDFESANDPVGQTVVGSGISLPSDERLLPVLPAVTEAYEIQTQDHTCGPAMRSVVFASSKFAQ